jgi:C4-dicarboxylate-binding protein DctP
LLPVHAEFESVVGKENLQEVYAIAAEVAKEEAAKKHETPKKKATKK